MSTTISDLKEKSAIELAEIIDGSTEANAAYVETHLTAPLKALGDMIPAGRAIVGDREVEGYMYTSIQTILDNLYNVYPGNNYDLDIVIETSDSGADLSISNSIERVKIRSNFDKYQINEIQMDTNTFTGVAFENVVLFNNIGVNIFFINCTFKNCEIKMGTYQISFQGCDIDNCVITNTSSIVVENDNTIYNSRLKTNSGNITFNQTSKMYGCYYNCAIINEENNQTQGLNIYAENL